MEEILKGMERFWSEAMQTLKEVVEKDTSEVVDPPARDPGQHEKTNDPFSKSP